MIVGFLHVPPFESGVTRYGRLLAAAGDDVLEVDTSLASVRGTYRAARSLRPAAAVHVQFSSRGWGGPLRAGARLLAVRLGARAPIVATWHDVYTGGRRGRATRQAAVVLRLAARVLFLSEDERDRAGSLGSSARSAVIPIYVEPTPPMPARDEARQSLALEGRVATVLGFVHRRKGHALAIDALATLPDEWTLVIAGGAPPGGVDTIAPLRDRARQLGVEGRVRFAGYLSDDDLGTYLAATDVAVCAFDRVSASASLATWIAARRPIVATDLPLTRGYAARAPHGVTLFAPRTAPALAKAMLDAATPEHVAAAAAELDDLASELSLERTWARHARQYRAVAGVRGGDGLRVVTSPPWRERTANPYNTLLYSAVEALGVTVEEAPPATPATCGADVWHLHWPESVLKPASPVEAAARAALLLARIARARRRGTRIAWTVHNLGPHEDPHPALTRWFLDALAARVDVAFALSDAGATLVGERFPVLRDRTVVTPIGRFDVAYRPAPPRPDARRELGLPTSGPLLVFFGQIRAYKNVPGLLAAFAELDDADARLLITGEPRRTDPDALLALAARDERVTIELGVVPAERVPIVVGAADLVVLPFREVLNSASAVLALSLRRPILVPATPTLVELRERTGGSWVQTYDGDLRGDAIRAALDRVGEIEAGPPPALPGWDDIAVSTVRAYEHAVRRG